MIDLGTYKEYINELDPAFFFTPEYKNLLQFTKTYNDEAEIALDPDNYSDSLGGYRIMEVTYLNKKGFIPMVTHVDFEGGFYVQKVDGARITLDFGSLGSSLLKALGFSAIGAEGVAADEVIQGFTDFVVNSIEPEDDLAKYFITPEKIAAMILGEEAAQSLYDDLMEHIYACAYRYFGVEESGTDTKNPYSFIQKTYPEGQSTLIPDTSNVFNNVLAVAYDTLPGIDIDYLSDFLKTQYENDADLRDIMTHDNVRTALLGGTTSTAVWLCIAGWDIDNNDIVATTESGKNQHYGARVIYKGNKEITYRSWNNGQTWELMSKNADTINSGTFPETLYNYRKSVGTLRSYNTLGTNKYPSVGYGTKYFWDSMGSYSRAKGYKVIGTTPNSNPISQRYPQWQTIDGNYPVGEPDPDNPEDPTYIWRGVPSRDNPIKIPPIPGLPPIKPIDIRTPENTHITMDEIPDINYGGALFSTYKLNNKHLDRLGEWLWDQDIIDKILQTFKNSPFDAIISLHQLYYDPYATKDTSIWLGLVNSEITDDGAGVNVKAVEKRYQGLGCGTVKIDKYFNDIRDYQTKISIYLPFIGIQELDVNEVMDSTLQVFYYIDVLTGDCLCNICMNRDGNFDNKTLYTFNGNCSSQLPLTGADRSRLYGNIANAIGGTISGIATGGIVGGVTGLAGGVVNTVLDNNVSIMKSGNVTGNNGAMGFKKPYLIIERPIPADAVDREKYIGRPANTTIKLSSASGYSEIEGSHVEDIDRATNTEKDMISNILQSGIIL